MKKLISCALAAVLMAAPISAYASELPTPPENGLWEIISGDDGEPDPENPYMSVKYVSLPSYTVTIPADVTLSETAVTTTSLGASNIKLPKNKYIAVSLDGEYTQTNQTVFNAKTSNSSNAATANYTISADSVLNPTHNAVTINDGGYCAAFLNPSDYKTYFPTAEGDGSSQSVELEFSAASAVYAGTYTEKLTFTISVETLPSIIIGPGPGGGGAQIPQ